MTEFTEGIPIEIRRWTTGKGADVICHDDEAKYYYNGEVKIPIGRGCRFEIVDGTGDKKGWYEIIDCKILGNDPVVEPPIMPKNAMQVPPEARMVSMPWLDFERMMNSKSALNENKVKSLDMAIKLYACLPKLEKDPRRAVDEVVMIAEMLSGYL